MAEKEPAGENPGLIFIQPDQDQTQQVATLTLSQSHASAVLVAESGEVIPSKITVVNSEGQPVGVYTAGPFETTARKSGLVSANVIGMKVVNAEGELLNANPQENPDLYWALLGGGGGTFGIVGEFNAN